MILRNILQLHDLREIHGSILRFHVFSMILEKILRLHVVGFASLGKANLTSTKRSAKRSFINIKLFDHKERKIEGDTIIKTSKIISIYHHLPYGTPKRTTQNLILSHKNTNELKISSLLVSS